MFLIIPIAFILSFFLCFFLLNFNNEIGQEGIHDTFLHGAWHGIFVALFILTPILLINKIFEPRPWSAVFINISYWVVTLALMGGVLDAMNHWEG